MLLSTGFFSVKISAQQLPDYTGYPSMFFQLNPAYTGTRGDLDARLVYRKQWVGFEDAPVTQFAGIHSRLWKGRLGIGTTMFKDVTGPTNRTDLGFTAAYHLHFPDVEFSAGFGADFMKYTIDGSKMTTHWTGDPAVDNTITDSERKTNARAGILLYNDRFHFGLGVLSMVNNKSEFYLNDTTKKSIVSYVPHYFFTCGYNFHGNPEYVWENNLMAEYVTGLPIMINYNLRVHYREKFMGGVSWRLKDAIALQAGYILLDHFQFIYSYDIGISPLRKGHSGSHEVMIGYRMNFGDHHGGYKNFDEFQKQKFHLF